MDELSFSSPWFFLLIVRTKSNASQSRVGERIGRENGLSAVSEKEWGQCRGLTGRRMDGESSGLQSIDPIPSIVGEDGRERLLESSHISLRFAISLRVVSRCEMELDFHSLS